MLIESLENRTLFTVPAGFTETRIVTNLDQPVAMAFAPDGRLFVTEKTGDVRVVDAAGQLLPAPFMSLTVNSLGERGALGITFDPNFATNRHLYVYYTATTPTIHNRLSRFTASAANPNVVEPGSEQVLIDFDELSSIYHNAGSLHFGPDGKLYVAVGDNVRGVVSQQLDNLWGKILRVNSDGTAPPDNPFFNQATGINRAIYAIGLRNAFTFAFEKATGRMYASEVGNELWEEIDDVTAGGNYGWPDTEGPTNDPRFDGPIYAYEHEGICNAITGALFYEPSAGAPNALPAEYHGRFFFGDLCGGIDAGMGGGWIKTIDPDTREVRDFGTSIQRPVDFDTGPDGSLYYLSNSRPGSAGHVTRIRFAGAGTDLNITVPPQDLSVAVGRPATFSVQASGSGTLSYQWQRDNGAGFANIAGATSAQYQLPSATLADNGATFRVIVSDGTRSVTSDAATLTVINSTPPTATITAPPAGTLFSGGQTITFSGTASDLEEGPLPPSAYTWRVDYITGDLERPAVDAFGGATGGSFTAASQTPFTGTDVRYRIHLTVRDSAGLETGTFVDVLPAVQNLRLDATPAGRGLRLTLDGQPVRTTADVPGVAGVERVLVAPATQTVNGVTYNFVQWSDGNTNPTRAVTTPAVGTPAGTGGATAVYEATNDGTGNPADANLVASLLKAPPSIITGRPTRATVQLRNAGGAAVNGEYDVALFASPDAWLDPEDPQVGAVRRRVRVAPNGVRRLPVAFTVPSSVAGGNYHLLAQADAGRTLSETREFDNVGASAAPLFIGPPVVDFSGAFAVNPTVVTRRGVRSVVATLSVLNSGNIPTAGPVTISLLASADGMIDNADVSLGNQTRVMRVRPGGRRLLRLRVALPSGLAAGAYRLAARIDPAGAVPEPDENNNDAVSDGTFTV